MSTAMLDLLNRSMDEQIARKSVPQGFPDLPDIPLARYADREFADLEMRGLWQKSWLIVGVESDVPQAGSYFLFQRLDRSIIISRGKDGVIRAFHNSCRHRGSALLTEPVGKVMRFICPYHNWGYELTGNLASVPSAHDFPGLDKSERGLVPVRCETFRGLVFINMDMSARPLNEHLAPLVPSLEGFPLEGLVTKDVFTFEMDCNWKIAFHNFLEIYHVNSVHPVTLAPYFDSPSYFISLLDKGHSSLATRKRKGRSIFDSDGPVPEGASEMFSELSIAPVAFPNLFVALDPSGFMFQTFWPVSVDRSVMDIRMVGWESSPHDDTYWNTVRERGLGILSEDKFLFPSLQRSMAVGAIDKIKMGYQERAIYWFEEQVDRLIGPASIPEKMRVAQVLEDYMKTPGK